MTTLYTLLTLLFIASVNMVNAASATSEQIIGRWISENGDFVVDVYKVGNKFNAKLVWYNPSGTSDPENAIDDSNPNPKLRSRKVIGMEVLRNLIYNTSNNKYEDGIIYDATTGKDWTAYAYFNNANHLIVKAYWRFKFICQTLTLKKCDHNQKPNSTPFKGERELAAKIN